MTLQRLMMSGYLGVNAERCHLTAYQSYKRSITVSAVETAMQGLRT